MNMYLINYITGKGAKEIKIKAINEQQAKSIFKIKYPNLQITSIWRYTHIKRVTIK